MVYGIVDVHFFSFFFFFFFSFFSTTILSGSYLWNRYSQRLQIECAAWSCCLIMHCCLPSNSLRYFFSFFFAKILSGPYLWNRYSQRLQIECAACFCGLILHSCLPSNSLCYFFFFFFHHDFVRAISLEPLLAETPNWVCCLVLRSNFALLLTIQFASLISSLINIISLLLTTFDWTKVRGIAPRSHTGRPRTCLVIVNDPRRGCYMGLSTFIFFSFFFFSFFSTTILSGPYLWNRYSQRLQIECAAWSCGLILHCCLPSNSLCYFFFRHVFVRAISL